jgi:hypothetical protein
MPFNSDIQDLVTKVNPNLNFYSSLQDVNRDVIKPLFLYHVPKTGGMSFQTAIECGQRNLRAVLDAKGIKDPIPGYGRIGTLQEMKDLPHSFFYFLVSHLPYGAHLHTDVTDFQLMSIFRDPIDRIKSAFTYQCMRQNQIPNEKRFVEFFQQQDNINLFCKSLHPNALNEVTEDHKAVIENLEQNFTTVVTANELHDAIEYYLSLYNLPNIVMGRINHTQNEFKLDISAYKDDILKLNQEDYELYEYVKANPKVPELGNYSDRLNQATSMVYQNQTKEKVSARGVPLPTEKSLNIIKKLAEQRVTPFDMMLMGFPSIIGQHKGINVA